MTRTRSPRRVRRSSLRPHPGSADDDHRLSELDDSDNTFIDIQPDQDDPDWFASVAVLDEGGYEIVRRDATRSEHEVSTDTSIGGIANDLTIWLAARDFPGRPSPRVWTSSSAQRFRVGAAAAGPRAPQPAGWTA